LIWTMWDVNGRRLVEAPLWTTRLIWTMWDVNLLFYCLSLRYDVGLIWTMWDVNKPFRMRRLWRLKRFDLNYVGCEHDKFTCFSAMRLGFDLNYVGCEHDHSQTHRRLAWLVWSELCGMWTKMECWLSFSMALFDLNYVGCEHGRPSASRVFKTSLIWTMWDVNFAPLQQQFTTWTGVWSELCGMWTYGTSRIPARPFLVWSELCGMWTETGEDVLVPLVSVWSELCGMWTSNFFTSCLL